MEQIPTTFLQSNNIYRTKTPIKDVNFLCGMYGKCDGNLTSHERLNKVLPADTNTCEKKIKTVLSHERTNKIKEMEESLKIQCQFVVSFNVMYRWYVYFLIE